MIFMKQGNNQVIVIVQKKYKKNPSTCVILNYTHVQLLLILILIKLLLKSNVLTGSTHDIIETLETASNHALSLILEMEEKIVDDKLYCPSSLGGGLLALEHHLLDVASVHNLVQGIFYMLPVKVGHNLFIR